MPEFHLLKHLDGEAGGLELVELGVIIGAEQDEVLEAVNAVVVGVVV
jgi:hypothetical protein